MTVEATPVETPVEDSSTQPVKNVSDEPQGEPTAETPAAPAEPVSDDADAEDTPPEGGRKSRAQERIEELAQTNKYLREHNEFLREHIAKSAPKSADPTPTAQPAVEDPGEPPTLESCDFDMTKFAKANGEWVKKAVSRGVQDELGKAKTSEQQQTDEQVIVQAANEFRKDHPDFDVLLSNPKLQFTPTILEALKDAGADSPALGYHLANNPDKLAKLAKMTPKKQSMQLGIILGEIKAQPKAPKTTTAPTKPSASAPAKKPTTTNAPPPPNPVSGAASPDVDPMKLSGTEWAALRRQELAEKKKGATRTVRSF